MELGALAALLGSMEVNTPARLHIQPHAPEEQLEVSEGTAMFLWQGVLLGLAVGTAKVCSRGLFSADNMQLFPCPDKTQLNNGSISLSTLSVRELHLAHFSTT